MSPRFKTIKEAILGKRYELSLAFLSAQEMRTVTRRTKGINKASNVLAFPLSKTSGEVLICRATAQKEAKGFGMSERTFVAYLFIHGCLHLKGLNHGARMESNERSLLRRFGFSWQESSQASTSAHIMSKSSSRSSARTRAKRRAF